MAYHYPSKHASIQLYHAIKLKRQGIVWSSGYLEEGRQKLQATGQLQISEMATHDRMMIPCAAIKFGSVIFISHASQLGLATQVLQSQMHTVIINTFSVANQQLFTDSSINIPYSQCAVPRSRNSYTTFFTQPQALLAINTNTM